MRHPDPNWGAGKLIPGPDGEPMGDPAAILELMRHGGSEKSASAYAAACEIWQELKDAPGLTEKQRRFETIKRALKSVEPKLNFVILNQKH